MTFRTNETYRLKFYLRSKQGTTDLAGGKNLHSPEYTTTTCTNPKFLWNLIDQMEMDPDVCGISMEQYVAGHGWCIFTEDDYAAAMDSLEEAVMV